MLFLIAAASMVTSEPAARSAAEARVSVRIERPALASAQEWTRASTQLNRRERIVRDERGALQLQRVIEYE